MMSIKLLFTPDGKTVLGAQIVGCEGVDKAIDLFAVAISHRMSVFELAEMELSYAPPFSSAKAASLSREVSPMPRLGTLMILLRAIVSAGFASTFK